MRKKRYEEKFVHYYTGDIPKDIVDIISSNDIKIFGDFGCGDGNLLYGIKKLGFLEKFERVIAIDISRIRLEKVKKIDEKIEVIEGDVSDNSLVIFKNNSIKFDLIILNQVIEHIKDEDQAIHNISNSLNKGGKLYLSTVYKKWYGWYFYRNKYKKWVIDPTHEREYSSEVQLLSKIESNGLRVLKNSKHMLKFPVLDFFLKRVGIGQNIYEKLSILKFLRKIKIPILGYYEWEIILEKI